MKYYKDVMDDLWKHDPDAKRSYRWTFWHRGHKNWMPHYPGHNNGACGAEVEAAFGPLKELSEEDVFLELL